MSRTRRRGTRSPRFAGGPAPAAGGTRPAPSGPPASPARALGTRLREALLDRRVAIALALGAVAAAVYLPTLRAGFINWDDPMYVTDNPHVRRFDWPTLVWAFTTPVSGTWHPLTWLSLVLDYDVWGPRPHGFHLTSLLVHATSTALLFVAWERLTGAVWRSAALAALFGLHPMRVESVAWVSERKDVLSVLFVVLTLLAWARYARRGTAAAYLVVVVTYVLATMSKVMVVTLPFALLLLDAWPLGRLSRRAVAEKVPLLVLSAPAILLSSAAAEEARSVAAGVSLLDRLANAVVSYVEYLRLTVWPVGLSPWYSHPALEGPPLGGLAVAGSVGFLVAVTALALVQRRARPWLAVGWLWYVGTLAPAIGVLQTGRQAMADRYSYIPHIGVFLIVAWAASELPVWRTPRARAAAAAAVAAVLATLATLTVRQEAVWRDTRTFWAYTARTSPRSFVAHQALGGLLYGAGDHAGAMAAYRRAVHLKPGVGYVHARLGGLFERAGRVGPAAAQYRKAIGAEPENAEYHARLGEVLLAAGRPAGARRSLMRALALRPGRADAVRALARAEAALAAP